MSARPHGTPSAESEAGSAGSPAASRAESGRAFRNHLLLALMVVILDQAAKYYAIHLFADRPPVEVLPVLSLVLIFNRGAAFGFLSQAGGWQIVIFSAVALLVSAVFVWLLRRIAGTRRQEAIAFALILGGAVGNLLDRLGAGVVTDFILVHYGEWQFPAFNVADMAITVGAILLIMDALGWRIFGKKRE